MFRINYSIIFVNDMKRSVAFYRDVFGIGLRFESPEWTEFDTEGATLALHAAKSAAGPEDSQDSGGRCRPGMSVPNLDEFHARLLEHDVECVQEPKEVFGTRIAQYRDPDGLIVSVSEQRSGSQAKA